MSFHAVLVRLFTSVVGVLRSCLDISQALPGPHVVALLDAVERALFSLLARHPVDPRFRVQVEDYAALAQPVRLGRMTARLRVKPTRLALCRGVQQGRQIISKGF